MATFIKGKKGNGILRDDIGTSVYKDPEIKLKVKDNRVKVGIFNLGVVLFHLDTIKKNF